MISTIVILLFCILVQTINCVQFTHCPLDTIEYKEEGRHLCYIILRHYEIKHIRKHIWMEPPLWTNDLQEGLGIVQSYWDAVRLCGMIPHLSPGKYELGEHDKGYARKEMAQFSGEWTKVYGSDVLLRLPTPQTEAHMRWLYYEVLNDPYYRTYGYQTYKSDVDRGKIWLGIKKSTSSLSGLPEFQPETGVQWLLDKSGDCGFLSRGNYGSSSNWGDGSYGAGRKAPNSGLYWLKCEDDTPMEDIYNADTFAGRHIVACEFDAIQDCEQKLNHTKCEYSAKHDRCMISGEWILVKNVTTDRFGAPCRTRDITDYPCPPEHINQCNKDCVFEWIDDGDCFVQDSKPNGTRYKCTRDDANGTMRQRLEISREPKYGGDPCPKNAYQLIPCFCNDRASIDFVDLGMLIALAILSVEF